MEINGLPHAMATVRVLQENRLPLNRKLGEHREGSKPRREKKMILFLPRIEFRMSVGPAHSLVTAAAEESVCVLTWAATDIYSF